MESTEIDYKKKDPENIKNNTSYIQYLEKKIKDPRSLWLMRL